jgi:hypothetical protein
MDQALRGRQRDDGLKGLIVRFLATGATDAALYKLIAEAAEEVRVMEEQSRELAKRYEVENDIAVCDARNSRVHYDKTVLLLIGQERARVSVVHDDTTVTAAARFDSGINLLEILNVDGGMPTRVSLPANQTATALTKITAQLQLVAVGENAANDRELTTVVTRDAARVREEKSPRGLEEDALPRA